MFTDPSLALLSSWPRGSLPTPTPPAAPLSSYIRQRLLPVFPRHLYYSGDDVKRENKSLDKEGAYAAGKQDEMRCEGVSGIVY